MLQQKSPKLQNSYYQLVINTNTVDWLEGSQLMLFMWYTIYS